MAEMGECTWRRETHILLHRHVAEIESPVNCMGLGAGRVSGRRSPSEQESRDRASDPQERGQRCRK